MLVQWRWWGCNKLGKRADRLVILAWIAIAAAITPKVDLSRQNSVCTRLTVDPGFRQDGGTSFRCYELTPFVIRNASVFTEALFLNLVHSANREEGRSAAVRFHFLTCAITGANYPHFTAA